MATPTITEREVVYSQYVNLVSASDQMHVVIQAVRLSSALPTETITFTTPSGWTQLLDASAATYSLCCAMWICFGNTTTGSTRFAINTSRSEYTVSGYYTLENSADFPSTYNVRNPTNSTGVSVSGVWNATDRAMLGMLQSADSTPNSPTWTCAGTSPPNNSTANTDNSNYCLFMWDETDSTSATFSGTWTTSYQATGCAATFAYQPPLTRDGVDGPSKVDGASSWESVDGT